MSGVKVLRLVLFGHLVSLLCKLFDRLWFY